MPPPSVATSLRWQLVASSQSYLAASAAAREVHAGDLAHERDETLLGQLGLYISVLLGGHALRDDEEAVGGAPNKGVTLAQGLYTHLVQVWAAVDDGELARLGLNVHAGEFEKFCRRCP